MLKNQMTSNKITKKEMEKQKIRIAKITQIMTKMEMTNTINQIVKMSQINKKTAGKLTVNMRKLLICQKSKENCPIDTQNMPNMYITIKS